MKEKKKEKGGVSGILYIFSRISSLLLVCAIFFSAFNPSYIFTIVDGNKMNNTTSLFTAAVSSNSILSSAVRGAINKGLLDAAPFTTLRVACVLLLLGIIVAGAAACMTLGNVRMKHLANKIMIGGSALMLIGGVLVFNFYNGAEDMIHVSESSSDEKAFEATLAAETDKRTLTMDGGHLTDADDNVYVVTIANNSGKDMEGWALEIKVGADYNLDNVLMVNKRTTIGSAQPDNHYNVALEGEYLIITPDNYVLKDGELSQEGESTTPDAANIPAGQQRLTLIADGIDVNTEVIVTDGSAAQSMAYKFPTCIYLYIVLAGIMLLTAIANEFLIGKAPEGQHMEMDTQYQLFLMFLPFILLIAAFCYLPLYGWRYAFMLDANSPMSAENFAGLHWFEQLFGTAAFRQHFIKVMINTLAMSGLGLATSWLPMAFAIFLNEIRSSKFRKFVTTFSTIPNFISWVLVYAIAFAIFAQDGLINSLMGTSIDFLGNSNHLWLKMLAWGTWKGIGWSAIIYISGIAGIDQQLYEAASIDGAGRFQRMWHITLPGLLPTYVVMLVMSVANILSNGMDQYLVFSNSATEASLEVLDLYVYNLGIVTGQIPLSTVVGMGKSIISILLFFIANNAAKAIRGNGIV